MRARNLKPGFFKNEDLASLDALARLLFEGLWCLSDREGRLQDRPLRIKAEVLPYESCDCDALLAQLTDKGFIRRYEADGRRCIEVVNFKEHQKPHPHEPETELPAPPQDVLNHDKSLHDTRCLSYSSSSLNASSLNAECLKLPTEACTEPAEPASVPTAAADQTEGTPGPETAGAGDPAEGVGDPVVLAFPVVGGKRGKRPAEWPLRQSTLSEFAESFPGVDVLAECKKALQWCRVNPRKRKTYDGLPEFLFRWLSRAQNTGTARTAPPSVAGKAVVYSDWKRQQEERQRGEAAS
jgi:hypothetical protein